MIPESEKWGYWEGLLFCCCLFLVGFRRSFGKGEMNDRSRFRCYLHMNRSWNLVLSCCTGFCSVSQQLVASPAPEIHLQNHPPAPVTGLLRPRGGWGLLWNCLYEGLENSAVHSLRELLLGFSAYNSKDHSSFLPRKSFKYYVLEC